MFSNILRNLGVACRAADESLPLTVLLSALLVCKYSHLKPISLARWGGDTTPLHAEQHRPQTEWLEGKVFPASLAALDVFKKGVRLSSFSCSFPVPPSSLKKGYSGFAQCQFLLQPLNNTFNLLHVFSSLARSYQQQDPGSQYGFCNDAIAVKMHHIHWSARLGTFSFFFLWRP